MQIHASTHPALQAVSGRYYSSLSPPLVNCGKQAESKKHQETHETMIWNCAFDKITMKHVFQMFEGGSSACYRYAALPRYFCPQLL